MLKVRGLCKRFGGLTVTDQLNLDVGAKELHAIIGPNGAGKTTLINQLSGELFPDEGSIEFDGHDVTGMRPDQRALAGLARSFQVSSVFPVFSALQNVMLAIQAQQGHSFGSWRSVLSDTRLTAPAYQALEEVGLAQQAHTPVDEMAHGARRQLELAMSLATGPKLLLLDEPMAGMSQYESDQVTELLLKLKSRYAIVLVEHDMNAVFALADRITVLVYGRSIVCAEPDAVRRDSAVQAAYLGDEIGEVMQ